MRHNSPTLLVMLVVLNVVWAGATVTIAAEPSADEPRNPFGFPGEWRDILRQGPVRKELKLSPQQAERLKAALDDAKLAPEESRKRIGEVLDAEQTARLKSISRRISGWFAVFEPEVASSLAITPEQDRRLSEIARKQHAEMKDFLSRARFRSREAMQQYIDECRDGAGELLKAALTTEQQKKLAELLGKPLAASP